MYCIIYKFYTEEEFTTQYKTHLLGGILVGVSALKVMNEVTGITPNITSIENMTFMLGAMAGSLFPDIDCRNSYIGRRARISSTIISGLFEHRGATHAPIIVTLFTAFLYLISKNFLPYPFIKTLLIGFYIGNLTHILLDMITKGGVPLLFPFTKTKFNLTKIKTGSIGEMVIFFIMIIAFVFEVKGFFLNL